MPIALEPTTMHLNGLSMDDTGKLSFEQFDSYLSKLQSVLLSEDYSQDPMFQSMLFDSLNLVYRRLDFINHPFIVWRRRDLVFKVLGCLLTQYHWTDDQIPLLLQFSMETATAETIWHAKNPSLDIVIFPLLDKLAYDQEFWAKHPMLIPKRVDLFTHINTYQAQNIDKIIESFSLNHLMENLHLHV